MYVSFRGFKCIDVAYSFSQMTIAQIVYDNELHFGYSHAEIRQKVAHFHSRSHLLAFLLMGCK